MTAQPFAQHDENPVDDHVVLFHEASWSDYERTLRMRGDRPVPRISFSKGVLELMSPSRQHEALKSLIGRLVEVWCTEREIAFNVFGSWTLESKATEHAVEPDECYVFGDDDDPQRPDLAIEVIWTSGRLDKRDIYRALGVRELWFWRKGRIVAYALRGDRYEEIAESDVLPGIDLVELTSFLDRRKVSDATRDYRAALRGRR
jgi:Uma2 family endonuclease